MRTPSISPIAASTPDLSRGCSGRTVPGSKRRSSRASGSRGSVGGSDLSRGSQDGHRVLLRSDCRCGGCCGRPPVGVDHSSWRRPPPGIGMQSAGSGPTEGERDIVPTETERVVDREIDLAGDGLRPCTTSRSISGSWLSRFSVGGTMPSRDCEDREHRLERADGADRVTQCGLRCVHRSVVADRLVIAFASAVSPIGVAVACALTWVMSRLGQTSGLRSPASSPGPRPCPRDRERRCGNRRR